MPYKIVVSEAALYEFEDAVNYYNSQKENLGNEFAALVNRSFEQISENPCGFQLMYDGIRHFVIGRFPYSIFYKIDDKENTIIIIAIFNAHRNPKIWQNRTKKFD